MLKSEVKDLIQQRKQSCKAVDDSHEYECVGRHRHFVGFLNVPVQASNSEKPPHLVAFYETIGIQRTHSRLNSGSPRRLIHIDSIVRS